GEDRRADQMAVRDGAFFFFSSRRRHTRLQGDWSSDVCSSDLKLMVERGLSLSRERAQAMILAGRVLVNGQKIEKSGSAIEQGAEIRLLGEEMKYVGRGGLKLEAALHHWKIDLTGRTCLDIGASTGGFTDCMLQNGAAQVIAVDTGYGQIAARLRSHERVRLVE